VALPILAAVGNVPIVRRRTGGAGRRP